MSLLLRSSRSLLVAARPATRIPFFRTFCAVPDDRKFTKSHEWLKVDEGVGTVGVTSHAQQELGDIVFADLPEVGKSFEAGDPTASIESVKATADIYTPVDGEVVAVNDVLNDQPELINASPFEDGWLFKIKITDASQVDGMLPKGDYEKVVADAS